MKPIGHIPNCLRHNPLKKSIPAWCLVAMLLGIAVAAGAQSPSLTPTAPIKVSADKLISGNNSDFAEFIGNVHASQDNFSIRSQRLKIYYTTHPGQQKGLAAEGQSIKKIVATGGVRILADNRTATTERAEYEVDSQILTLSGENSKIVSGKNSITGSKITFYRVENRVRVEGAPTRQVQALYYSDEDSPDPLFSSTRSSDLRKNANRSQPPESVPAKPETVSPAPAVSPDTGDQAAPTSPPVVTSKSQEERAAIDDTSSQSNPLPAPNRPAAVKNEAKAEKIPEDPKPHLESQSVSKTPALGSDNKRADHVSADPPSLSPDPKKEVTPEARDPRQSAAASSPTVASISQGPSRTDADTAMAPVPPVPPEPAKDKPVADKELTHPVTEISVGSLQIRAALAPFENRSGYEAPGLETRFQKDLLALLAQECPHVGFVDSADPNNQRFLATLPKTASGHYDAYALAHQAGRNGLNAVIIPILYGLDPVDRELRILWYHSAKQHIRIKAGLIVFDMETAAKLLDTDFTEEVAADDVAESLNGRTLLDASLLQEAISEIIAEMSDAVCDSLAKKPWAGYVVAHEGDAVVLSAGSDIGLIPGNTLDIYNRETIEGIHGQRFYLPGSKSGELQILSVSPTRSQARILSGETTKPGSIVKSKK